MQDARQSGGIKSFLVEISQGGLRCFWKPPTGGLLIFSEARGQSSDGRRVVAVAPR